MLDLRITEPNDWFAPLYSFLCFILVGHGEGALSAEPLLVEVCHGRPGKVIKNCVSDIGQIDVSDLSQVEEPIEVKMSSQGSGPLGLSQARRSHEDKGKWSVDTRLLGVRV